MSSNILRGDDVGRGRGRKQPSKPKPPSNILRGDDVGRGRGRGRGQPSKPKPPSNILRGDDVGRGRGRKQPPKPKPPSNKGKKLVVKKLKQQTTEKDFKRAVKIKKLEAELKRLKSQ